MSLRATEPDPKLRDAADEVAVRLRRLAERLLSDDVHPACLEAASRHLDVALAAFADLGPAPEGGGREEINGVVGTVHGSANPFAPPLALTHLPGRVEGRCVLARVHEGSPGFAHGGVSLLLLDEISAQVPELLGTERVTTAMTALYRRPVPLYTPLLAVARLGPQEVVEATLATEADPGRILMRADVALVRLRPDQVERLRQARPVM